MIAATADQLPAGMPTLRPEHVISSQLVVRRRQDGGRYGVLVTWFVDRRGEKDCWEEEVGDLF